MEQNIGTDFRFLLWSWWTDRVFCMSVLMQNLLKIIFCFKKTEDGSEDKALVTLRVCVGAGA